MSFYSKKNKKTVDAFLNTPSLIKMVQEDLGPPVKITVDWENGVVRFCGHYSAKMLSIKTILDVAKGMR